MCDCCLQDIFNGTSGKWQPCFKRILWCCDAPRPLFFPLNVFVLTSSSFLDWLCLSTRNFVSLFNLREEILQISIAHSAKLFSAIRLPNTGNRDEPCSRGPSWQSGCQRVERHNAMKRPSQNVNKSWPSHFAHSPSMMHCFGGETDGDHLDHLLPNPCPTPLHALGDLNM